MEDEPNLLQNQRDQAMKKIADINTERNLKGNGNVTAKRYGELVKNMVKYAESEMALDLIEKDKLQSSSTASHAYNNSAHQEDNLSGHQHLETGTLRGQNVINPS